MANNDPKRMAAINQTWISSGVKGRTQDEKANSKFIKGGSTLQPRSVGDPGFQTNLTIKR